MPASRSKCEKKGRVYVKKHKAYKDGPEIKSQCRKKSRSKSRKSKSRKSKSKKSRKSKSKKSRKSKSKKSKSKKSKSKKSKSDKKSSKDSAKKEFRSLVRELCKETPGSTPDEPGSFQFSSSRSQPSGLEYRPEPSARQPFDAIDNSMLGVFEL
jgi:arginine/serine-rich splicing factor 12